MRGIAADERWKAALHEAADQCDVVLALVSPQWLASDWCKAETEAALRMGKRIIVALIGAVPLDLTDEQWVDLADPDGFSQLKESLRRLGLDPSTESVHVQKFPARETHDAPVAPSAEPRVAQ
jgi:hypothetical protein